MTTVELFTFLANIYFKNNDESNLKRIISYAEAKSETVIKTKSILFDFFNEKNDYDQAKDVIIDSFIKNKKSNYFKEYHRILDYLHYADKVKFEETLIDVIKKKNIKD